MYRFIILTMLILSLAGCSTIMMNGEVTSDQGEELGPAHMEVFKQRGLKTYSVKAELPDETVFNGEMKFGDKEVTMYTADGVSMNCDFETKDPANEFDAGGTGICATSDGQKIKVKF